MLIDEPYLRLSSLLMPDVCFFAVATVAKLLFYKALVMC